MARKTPTVVISYSINDDNCSLSDSRSEFFTNLNRWAHLNLERANRDLHDMLESRSDEIDLYHMAKRRQAGLNNLGWAEDYGIDTINSAEGAKLMNNRARMLDTLEDLGIPVPAWDEGSARDVRIEPPAVVKTIRETENGKHDIEYFEEGEEMDFQDPRLVQEFVEHEYVIKAYNVGDEVLTVQVGEEGNGDHIDPRTSETKEVEPAKDIINYMENIREETGCELFEVDILDGDLVVDVNSVPYLDDTELGMDLYEQLIQEKAY